ncbi:MAG: hypothetical protein GY861_28625 [bacterium]|nr:hypothetical protein [bacterium]
MGQQGMGAALAGGAAREQDRYSVDDDVSKSDIEQIKLSSLSKEIDEIDLEIGTETDPAKVNILKEKKAKLLNEYSKQFRIVEDAYGIERKQLLEKGSNRIATFNEWYERTLGEADREIDHQQNLKYLLRDRINQCEAEKKEIFNKYKEEAETSGVTQFSLVKKDVDYNRLDAELIDLRRQRDETINKIPNLIKNRNSQTNTELMQKELQNRNYEEARAKYVQAVAEFNKLDKLKKMNVPYDKERYETLAGRTDQAGGSHTGELHDLKSREQILKRESKALESNKQIEHERAALLRIQKYFSAEIEGKLEDRISKSSSQFLDFAQQRALLTKLSEETYLTPAEIELRKRGIIDAGEQAVKADAEERLRVAEQKKEKLSSLYKEADYRKDEPNPHIRDAQKAYNKGIDTLNKEFATKMKKLQAKRKTASPEEIEGIDSEIDNARKQKQRRREALLRGKERYIAAKKEEQSNYYPDKKQKMADILHQMTILADTGGTVEKTIYQVKGEFGTGHSGLADTVHYGKSTISTLIKERDRLVIELKRARAEKRIEDYDKYMKELSGLSAVDRRSLRRKVGELEARLQTAHGVEAKRLKVQIDKLKESDLEGGVLGQLRQIQKARAAYSPGVTIRYARERIKKEMETPMFLHPSDEKMISKMLKSIAIDPKNPDNKAASNTSERLSTMKSTYDAKVRWENSQYHKELAKIPSTDRYKREKLKAEHDRQVNTLTTDYESVRNRELKEVMHIQKRETDRRLKSIDKKASEQSKETTTPWYATKADREVIGINEEKRQKSLSKMEKIQRHRKRLKTQLETDDRLKKMSTEERQRIRNKINELDRVGTEVDYDLRRYSRRIRQQDPAAPLESPKFLRDFRHERRRVYAGEEAGIIEADIPYLMGRIAKTQMKIDSLNKIIHGPSTTDRITAEKELNKLNREKHRLSQEMTQATIEIEKKRKSALKSKEVQDDMNRIMQMAKVHRKQQLNEANRLYKRDLERLERITETRQPSKEVGNIISEADRVRRRAEKEIQEETIRREARVRELALNAAIAIPTLEMPDALKDARKNKEIQEYNRKIQKIREDTKKELSERLLNKYENIIKASPLYAEGISKKLIEADPDKAIQTMSIAGWRMQKDIQKIKKIQERIEKKKAKKLLEIEMEYNYQTSLESMENKIDKLKTNKEALKKTHDEFRRKIKLVDAKESGLRGEERKILTGKINNLTDNLREINRKRKYATGDQKRRLDREAVKLAQERELLKRELGGVYGADRTTTKEASRLLSDLVKTGTLSETQELVGKKLTTGGIASDIKSSVNILSLKNEREQIYRETSKIRRKRKKLETDENYLKEKIRKDAKEQGITYKEARKKAIDNLNKQEKKLINERKRANNRIKDIEYLLEVGAVEDIPSKEGKLGNVMRRLRATYEPNIQYPIDEGWRTAPAGVEYKPHIGKERHPEILRVTETGAIEREVRTSVQKAIRDREIYISNIRKELERYEIEVATPETRKKLEEIGLPRQRVEEFKKLPYKYRRKLVQQLKEHDLEKAAVTALFKEAKEAKQRVSTKYEDIRTGKVEPLKEQVIKNLENLNRIDTKYRKEQRKLKQHLSGQKELTDTELKRLEAKLQEVEQQLKYAKREAGAAPKAAGGVLGEARREEVVLSRLEERLRKLEGPQPPEYMTTKLKRLRLEAALEANTEKKNLLQEQIRKEESHINRRVEIAKRATEKSIQEKKKKIKEARVEARKETIHLRDKYNRLQKQHDQALHINELVRTKTEMDNTWGELRSAVRDKPKRDAALKIVSVDESDPASIPSLVRKKVGTLYGVVGADEDKVRSLETRLERLAGRNWRGKKTLPKKAVPVYKNLVEEYQNIHKKMLGEVKNVPDLQKKYDTAAIKYEALYNIVDKEKKEFKKLKSSLVEITGTKIVISERLAKKGASAREKFVKSLEALKKELPAKDAEKLSSSIYSVLQEKYGVTMRPGKKGETRFYKSGILDTEYKVVPEIQTLITKSPEWKLLQRDLVKKPKVIVTQDTIKKMEEDGAPKSIIQKITPLLGREFSSKKDLAVEMTKFGITDKQWRDTASRYAKKTEVGLRRKEAALRQKVRDAATAARLLEKDIAIFIPVTQKQVSDLRDTLAKSKSPKEYNDIGERLSKYRAHLAETRREEAQAYKLAQKAFSIIDEDFKQGKIADLTKEGKIKLTRDALKRAKDISPIFKGSTRAKEIIQEYVTMKTLEAERKKAVVLTTKQKHQLREKIAQGEMAVRTKERIEKLEKTVLHTSLVLHKAVAVRKESAAIEQGSSREHRERLINIDKTEKRKKAEIVKKKEDQIDKITKSRRDGKISRTEAEALKKNVLTDYMQESVRLKRYYEAERNRIPTTINVRRELLDIVRKEATAQPMTRAEMRKRVRTARMAPAITTATTVEILSGKKLSDFEREIRTEKNPDKRKEIIDTMNNYVERAKTMNKELLGGGTKFHRGRAKLPSVEKARKIVKELTEKRREARQELIEIAKVAERVTNKRMGVVGESKIPLIEVSLEDVNKALAKSKSIKEKAKRTASEAKKIRDAINDKKRRVELEITDRTQRKTREKMRSALQKATDKVEEQRRIGKETEERAIDIRVKELKKAAEKKPTKKVIAEKIYTEYYKDMGARVKPPKHVQRAIKQLQKSITRDKKLLAEYTRKKEYIGSVQRPQLGKKPEAIEHTRYFIDHKSLEAIRKARMADLKKDKKAKKRVAGAVVFEEFEIKDVYSKKEATKKIRREMAYVGNMEFGSIEQALQTIPEKYRSLVNVGKKKVKLYPTGEIRGEVRKREKLIYVKGQVEKGTEIPRKGEKWRREELGVLAAHRAAAPGAPSVIELERARKFQPVYGQAKGAATKIAQLQKSIESKQQAISKLRAPGIEAAKDVRAGTYQLPQREKQRRALGFETEAEWKSAMKYYMRWGGEDGAAKASEKHYRRSKHYLKKAEETRISDKVKEKEFLRLAHEAKAKGDLMFNAIRSLEDRQGWRGAERKASEISNRLIEGAKPNKSVNFIPSPGVMRSPFFREGLGVEQGRKLGHAVAESLGIGNIPITTIPRYKTRREMRLMTAKEVKKAVQRGDYTQAVTRELKKPGTYTEKVEASVKRREAVTPEIMLDYLRQQRPERPVSPVRWKRGVAPAIDKHINMYKKQLKTATGKELDQIQRSIKALEKAQSKQRAAEKAWKPAEEVLEKEYTKQKELRKKIASVRNFERYVQSRQRRERPESATKVSSPKRILPAEGYFIKRIPFTAKQYLSTKRPTALERETFRGFLNEAIIAKVLRKRRKERVREIAKGRIEFEQRVRTSMVRRRLDEYRKKMERRSLSISQRAYYEKQINRIRKELEEEPTLNSGYTKIAQRV